MKYFQSLSSPPKCKAEQIQYYIQQLVAWGISFLATRAVQEQYVCGYLYMFASYSVHHVYFSWTSATFTFLILECLHCSFVFFFVSCILYLQLLLTHMSSFFLMLIVLNISMRIDNTQANLLSFYPKRLPFCTRIFVCLSLTSTGQLLENGTNNFFDLLEIMGSLKSLRDLSRGSLKWLETPPRVVL